jgi:hypothetical protein
LYKSIKDDVTIILFRKVWGFGSDRKTVFTDSAIIIKSETAPCHENAPKITITIAKQIAVIVFFVDFPF